MKYWIRATFFVLAVLLANSSLAQECTGWSNQITPMGFETITVSSSAIGFTSSAIDTGTAKAAYAMFTVETANIRWRVDGASNPTAAVGHLATAGSQTFFVCGVTAVSQFRAIRVSSDATITVTYFKGN